MIDWTRLSKEILKSSVHYRRARKLVRISKIKRLYNVKTKQEK